MRRIYRTWRYSRRSLIRIHHLTVPGMTITPSGHLVKSVTAHIVVTEDRGPL